MTGGGAAFLILWIVCGILAAVLAANKGRSPVAWLFLGFALGILVPIIVAVLPALPSPEEGGDQ